MNESAAPQCHPIVWSVLEAPFGAINGFVGVALTFLASRHGVSITESAFLVAANALINWLKWLWSPVVDTTLSPRRWYMWSTLLAAVGVFAMSAIALGPTTLWTVIAIVIASTVASSVSAMSVEAMVALTTPAEEVGRVSGWLQAGNLGGTGLGGGIGLLLLEHMPETWMAGTVMGGLLGACTLALWITPPVGCQAPVGPTWSTLRWAVADLWESLRAPRGRIAALLLLLPIGTGAASSVLTQAAVAEHWHAGANEVALVQGVLTALVTAGGCFAGGWLCGRALPRSVYAGTGLVLAGVAVGFALAPASVETYVGGSLIYNFLVGIVYAAFTAVTLDAIGHGAAATKYTVFASLSNFPIWWMSLLLAWIADLFGPDAMLYSEAALGVAALVVFIAGTRWIGGRHALSAAE